MRKFIISDLHGCGEVYNSIMGYLENISLIDPVELYINGDLIDRGIDSFDMLKDVRRRINGKGNIKINYLGGNHELLMYKELKKLKPNESISVYSDWSMNGGYIIGGSIEELEEKEIRSWRDFIGDLKIYHKFKEKINDNNLLLVHAKAPTEVLDKCNLKISDETEEVFDSVWFREDDFTKDYIGKKGYFTIIGHTPVEEGFLYNKEKNYINIDGGCAGYAIGRFEYNKVPLIEIEKNRLKMLIFNHNNEIIDGYYLKDDLVKMNNKDLNRNRVFINPIFNDKEEKVKKLIKEFNE